MMKSDMKMDIPTKEEREETLNLLWLESYRTADLTFITRRNFSPPLWLNLGSFRGKRNVLLLFGSESEVDHAADKENSNVNGGFLVSFYVLCKRGIETRRDAYLLVLLLPTSICARIHTGWVPFYSAPVRTTLVHGPIVLQRKYDLIFKILGINILEILKLMTNIQMSPKNFEKYNQVIKLVVKI